MGQSRTRSSSAVARPVSRRPVVRGNLPRLRPSHPGTRRSPNCCWLAPRMTTPRCSSRTSGGAGASWCRRRSPDRLSCSSSGRRKAPGTSAGCWRIHRSTSSRTARDVRAEMRGDSSGHDWWHVDRVRALAILLAGREHADPYVVELTALLHSHLRLQAPTAVIPNAVRGQDDQLNASHAWRRIFQDSPAGQHGYVPRTRWSRGKRAAIRELIRPALSSARIALTAAARSSWAG